MAADWRRADTVHLTRGARSALAPNASRFLGAAVAKKVWQGGCGRDCGSGRGGRIAGAILGGVATHRPGARGELDWDRGGIDVRRGDDDGGAGYVGLEDLDELWRERRW